eukprot:2456716-Pleurochrysis_carterae.AAC.1
MAEGLWAKDQVVRARQRRTAVQEEAEVVRRSGTGPGERGRAAGGHALRWETREMLRAQRRWAFWVRKHLICAIKRGQALEGQRDIDVGERRGLAAPGGDDAIAEVGVGHRRANRDAPRTLR